MKFYDREKEMKLLHSNLEQSKKYLFHSIGWTSPDRKNSLITGII